MKNTYREKLKINRFQGSTRWEALKCGFSNNFKKQLRNMATF